jgi:hypothetical protein
MVAKKKWIVKIIKQLNNQNDQNLPITNKQKQDYKDWLCYI